MSENKTKDKSRTEIMHEIEHKHFGRCLNQFWDGNRRTLVELMMVRDTGEAVVVVKQFDHRVPTSGSGKPWPDLVAAQVYAVIDQGNMTWDGLNQALAAYRDKHKIVE